MTPQEALGAIAGLEKFGIRLGLERTLACLEALGGPHRAFPSIHVGGTNGKGSTSLLLASVLSAAGYRTGLYTSPPLECFGERIRVDGLELRDEAVPALYQAVLAAGREGPDPGGMTQFEVITAMAFLHFARVPVDAAVVEVGLGGRLDSTNVLVPEVAVLTNVGLEHAEHLGGTLEAIAREKAGIVKPGVPVVTGAEGEALRPIEEVAASRGSAMRVRGVDFHVSGRAGELEYRGPRWHLRGLRLGLLGSFQEANLALALAALEILEERGWRVPEEAVRQAVREARWPGRLEVLGSGPRVVLDGAHNPHASRVLARSLREDLTYERLWLILGILGDKDARSILRDLIPQADEVVLTRPSSARARDPEEIERLARDVRATPLHTLPTVPEALDWVLKRARPTDLVCVTGSLTTVGDARAHLRSLGWVR